MGGAWSIDRRIWIVCIGEMRNAHKILVISSEGQRLFGRPKIGRRILSKCTLRNRL